MDTSGGFRIAGDGVWMSEAENWLQDVLLKKHILSASGVDGLYARGELIEAIVARISAWVLHSGAAEEAEIFRFPPVLPRRHFEASGYFRHFPNLAGTIHCFCGDEETHR